MDDLEKAIRLWRRRIAREAVLSRQDLEELEDHLRSSVAVRLTAGDSAQEALATARQELGAAHDLAVEYRKVEPKGWRNWVYAGLAVFVVSFFLPATEGLLGNSSSFRGIEAFLWALDWEEGNGLGLLSALTNLLLPLALWRVWRRDDEGIHGLAGIIAAAAFLNLWWLTQIEPVSDLMIGYFAWVSSFCLTATGLSIKARQQDRKAKPVTA